MLAVQLAAAEGELRLSKALMIQAEAANRQQRALDEVDAVCLLYGVTETQLKSRVRTRAIAEPRHELMRRLRNEHGWMFKEIGFLLGGRDHTTIIHGVRAAEAKFQHLSAETNSAIGEGGVE